MKKQYVAVNGKTDDGKDVYCIHPLRWTTNLGEAHYWESETVANEEVNAMNKVYGVNAVVVPVRDINES